MFLWWFLSFQCVDCIEMCLKYLVFFGISCHRNFRIVHTYTMRWMNETKWMNEWMQFEVLDIRMCFRKLSIQFLCNALRFVNPRTYFNNNILILFSQMLCENEAKMQNGNWSDAMPVDRLYNPHYVFPMFNDFIVS